MNRIFSLIATACLAFAACTGWGGEDLHGPWETVVMAVKKVSHPGGTEVQLQIPGAREKLPVRAIMQPGRKPLVVVLGGTFGQKDGVYANELMSFYAAQGCHVMTFDGFFNRAFVHRTAGYGAPGNLEADAAMAVKIVDAFIQQQGLRTRVEKVGLVGLSYGGGVALHVDKLSQELKARKSGLPFPLAGVYACSVPVSYLDSMNLLDEYRNLPFTLDTIGPLYLEALKGTAAVPPQGYTRAMMLKAIGDDFKAGLANTLERVDRLYYKDINQSLTERQKAALQPYRNLRDRTAGNMEREEDAKRIGFGKYTQLWLAPYWKTKTNGRIGETEILQMGDLGRVLEKTSPNVRVILAANDPLNLPGTAELTAAAHRDRVVLLADGGHLGYVQSPLMKDLFKNIFNYASQPIAVAP